MRQCRTSNQLRIPGAVYRGHGAHVAPGIARSWWPLLLILFVIGAPAAFAKDESGPVLSRFMQKIPAAQLMDGANGYGTIDRDTPVASLLKDGKTIAYVYVTSDFVGTTGYSGKPIHVMVAISPAAKLLAVKLVEHAEPIVLIGIPDRKIKALTGRYAGLDLVVEAAAGGSGHDVDIISGATVTIMVIDDSIVRSGLKVARALGLGGLEPAARTTGPRREIDPRLSDIRDWPKMSGDGALRRLSLDISQINAAFAASGDTRAAERPEAGEPGETFIELYAALVSVPVIGRSLLGEDEYKNLTDWLKNGEHAILVAGRGRYSFKGSGYVRGGIFDRIQLIQGDRSVRFRDKGHRRLGAAAAEGIPSFSELDLFKIPADIGFQPTEPWRLQLLVHRAIGPIKKSFQTFNLAYRLPDAYTRPRAVTPIADVQEIQMEAEAKKALWLRVWCQNIYNIAGLVFMLSVLTVAFFGQKFLTVSERATYWFRIVFLTATLLFIGWYANAQLSVVNLMALANALSKTFTWDAFLLDPMVFILWFSVAAALIFWGRGAYCGWLCPFGALQELTNGIAKALKVPQLIIPWALHERLWPIKYIIFLGLFGLSLGSLPMAEQFAEVEPFKTAIILKFDRAWPFVTFAVGILAIGLFIERFYCRYLCPLGAALAIPGRMRMFDWLKRYHQCGNPCQVCSNECMVQAIHPLGEINPNECLYCLHCQVRYQDKKVCPVCIKRARRSARLRGEEPLQHPSMPETAGRI